MRGFTVSSRLAAPPERVWERVTSVHGVNDEFRPFLRMTVPRGSDATLRTGDLGRSWVLLFGLLPVDYDDLHIESIEPQRGFRERSRLASARAWHHDRTLEPLDGGGGCRLTDRIAFEPRIGVLGRPQELLLHAIFRWRHRRLRRHFG